MKLYYNPLSTYSQKAMCAFNEAGVAYDGEIVQLMDPSARAEYMKIYPMCKVPAVVADDGHMVPESSIIIEWLCDEHNAKLIPGDPTLARQARFKDRMFDNYLTEPVGTLFFQSMKPEDQKDQERIEKAMFHINTMYGYMEQDMANKTWAMGGDFSIADCSAAPALFYLSKFVPYDDKPIVKAYADRLMARPSYAKVLAETIPALEAFQQSMAA